MKSVLISIQPKWCELIAAGKKTVEVRKTKPKLEPPFKCYIYCTKSSRKTLSYSDYCGYDMEDFRKDFIANGQIIGEFVCDRKYQYASDLFRSAPVEGADISTEDMAKFSCLTAKELYEYEHSTEPKENCICLVGLYGWHISNLKIYDEPKPLDEFFYACDKQEGTDCSVCIDHRETKCKAVTRPPQSWCYVEEVP